MIGISFGTWAWGNKLVWGYQPERDDPLLKKTFQKAISGGLILIDTADSYGTGVLNGRSELLLGEFIACLSQDQKKRIAKLECRKILSKVNKIASSTS